MTQPYSQQTLHPDTPPQPMAYASPGMDVYHASIGRGRVVRVLLFIIIALELVGVGINAYELGLPPGTFESADVDISVAYLATLLLWGLLYLGIFITTAIVFCMWMYRAHANLRALGRRDLDYTSGWAAGAWFVPFLNLVRPFRIMKEIYKGSTPRGGITATADPAAWKHAPDPAILGWWWAAWLISNFAANISMRMEMRGDASMQHTALYIELLTAPISIAAAWLAIRITQTIDEMQTDRYAALAQYPTEPQPYAPPQYDGR